MSGLPFYWKTECRSETPKLKPHHHPLILAVRLFCLIVDSTIYSRLPDGRACGPGANTTGFAQDGEVVGEGMKNRRRRDWWIHHWRAKTTSDSASKESICRKSSKSRGYNQDALYSSKDMQNRNKSMNRVSVRHVHISPSLVIIIIVKVLPYDMSSAKDAAVCLPYEWHYSFTVKRKSFRFVSINK